MFLVRAVRAPTYWVMLPIPNAPAHALTQTKRYISPNGAGSGARSRPEADRPAAGVGHTASGTKNHILFHIGAGDALLVVHPNIHASMRLVRYGDNEMEDSISKGSAGNGSRPEGSSLVLTQRGQHGDKCQNDHQKEDTDRAVENGQSPSFCGYRQSKKGNGQSDSSQNTRRALNKVSKVKKKTVEAPAGPEIVLAYLGKKVVCFSLVNVGKIQRQHFIREKFFFSSDIALLHGVFPMEKGPRQKCQQSGDSQCCCHQWKENVHSACSGQLVDDLRRQINGGIGAQRTDSGMKPCSQKSPGTIALYIPECSGVDLESFL